VQVSFDVLLPRCPCALIGIDFKDYIGDHGDNIFTDMQKFRISEKGIVLGQTDFLNESQYINMTRQNELATAAVLKKEGCQIVGKINVSLAPGDFHFASHPPYDKILKELQQ